MKGLSVPEVEALFGEAGFSVSLAHARYRSALVLDDQRAARQARIGARPPSETTQLLDFARALNRWLPTLRSRLLWIDHWGTGVYGADGALIDAARRGLGEMRGLEEAPGHLFGPHDYAEEDQAKTAAEQSQAVALLAGLIVQVLISGSDGWLIAEGGVDRIEFWEGNLYFHAQRAERIAEAEALLQHFECSRTLI